MDSHQTRTAGFVLATVLGIMVVVALMLAITMIVSVTNLRSASAAQRTTAAQLAAQAGLEDAIQEIWLKPWGTSKATTVDAYLAALENHEITTSSGSGKLLRKDLAGTPVTFGPFSLQNGATYTFTSTRIAAGTSGVAAGDTVFDIRSTGTLSDGSTRVLEQRLVVGGRQFEGFDFALLTRNVECVFCHTSVRSLETFAGNPSTSAPHERVKVAALDHVRLRPDNEYTNARHNAVDTVIAGTVYLRGSFTDHKGNSLVNNVKSTAATTERISFRTTLPAGQTKVTDTKLEYFDPAECSTVSACTSNGNMYVDYPDRAEVLAEFDGQWPADPLPDNFPMPIPDTNADRTISNSEWDDVVTASINGKDPNNPKGSITGGVRKAYTPGTKATGWPALGDSAATGSSASDSPQNLVLDGNDSGLNINGTVYVNGDVVIRGRIKGDGKIIARGNVYVLGDVQYDCTDTQGKADCDYGKSSTLPKLAVVAGGNIVMGDPLTRHGTATSNYHKAGEQDPGSSLARLLKQFGTTKSGTYEIKHKKRGELVTVEGTGKTSEKCTVDYNGRRCWTEVDEDKTYYKEQHLADLPSPNNSFTVQQIQLFNTREFYKAAADSSYVPRFYRLRNEVNGAVPILVDGSKSEGEKHYWNGKVIELYPEQSDPYVMTKSWVTGWEQDGEEHYKVGKYEISRPASFKIKADSSLGISSDRTITQLEAKNILARGPIVSIMPADPWLSGDALKTMYYGSVECNPTSLESSGKCTNHPQRAEGALRTDGLLYSANGTFSIARPRGKTHGKIDIRGAIITSDLGILAPGVKTGQANDYTGGGNPERDLLTENWPNPTDSTAHGLNLYYDSRLRSFMNINDAADAVLVRSDWKVATR